MRSVVLRRQNDVPTDEYTMIQEETLTTDITRMF